jgi:hypothetical protein
VPIKPKPGARLKFKVHSLRKKSGGVLTSGARLYEPQRFPMHTKPLRVADPRSENKLGHCRNSATAFVMPQGVKSNSKFDFEIAKPLYW